MKLSKNTRELVKIGTLLSQNEMVLEVVNIWQVGRGTQITSKIVKHPKKEFEGHLIYGEPMSWYYGMEIKEI